MPCYTIQTVNVEVGKMNADLLEAALKTLGYQVAKSSSGVSFTGQNVEGRYASAALNLKTWGGVTADSVAIKIKVAYSRQVVIGQAKKYGWQLKETKANTFEVVRR